MAVNVTAKTSHQDPFVCEQSEGDAVLLKSENKIGVVNRLISLTESKLEESELFHFFRFCL